MILCAKHISKYLYSPAQQKVLDNISLDIEEGELISVFGESGSGKSSLLYIFAILDTDFEGELTISGKQIKSLSQNELAELRNRNIGFVYQFHYLLPEFSVLQNIMLPGMKRSPDKIDLVKENALELLNEVGMSPFAERPAYQLSGGQQQRVAIARALINDPALIIADEPTGNLDQKNSKLIFELLKNIAEEKGKSILLATHNMSIRKKSHRSVEMIDGVLRL